MPGYSLLKETLTSCGISGMPLIDHCYSNLADPRLHSQLRKNNLLTLYKAVEFGNLLLNFNSFVYHCVFILFRRHIYTWNSRISIYFVEASAKLISYKLNSLKIDF